MPETRSDDDTGHGAGRREPSEAASPRLDEVGGRAGTEAPRAGADLAWMVLLGRWMEVAQAAVALPPDAEGRAWRASIPSVIELQAVTFALADLASLAPEDRAVGRDRAAFLIERAAARLDAAWRGVPMPAPVLEMLSDASLALAWSAYVGATELMWPGPGEFIMPSVQVPADPSGTLLVMQPGTIVFPGQPVAWWVGRDGSDLERHLSACASAVTDRPRQVYRVWNDDGRFAGDEMRFVLEEPAAGMPLLVPITVDGECVGALRADPVQWLAAQRAAGVRADRGATA